MWKVRRIQKTLQVTVIKRDSEVRSAEFNSGSIIYQVSGSLCMYIMLCMYVMFTYVTSLNVSFLICKRDKWNCSVMSDSLRSHGLWPTRLLHPWNFLGKSTRVGTSPGDLPDPGIKPRSPALQADTLLSESPGNPVQGTRIMPNS